MHESKKVFGHGCKICAKQSQRETCDVCALARLATRCRIHTGCRGKVGQVKVFGSFIS